MTDTGNDGYMFGGRQGDDEGILDLLEETLEAAPSDALIVSASRGADGFWKWPPDGRAR
jgi:hypothetical protein